MKRFALTSVLLTASTAAMAHPGHVEPSSGHDHYVAIAAVAVAAVVAVVGAIKARRTAQA